MQLPEEFANKVKRVWGKEGERWVSRFPETLAACAAAWQLRELIPIPDLSYNFIAQARTHSGQAVILKMGVPNPELTTEVAALQAYHGQGAVKLLAYDPDRGALLLERLNPGTQLHRLGDNRQESQIAARLMAQLSIPPPDQHNFPTLRDWSKAFQRVLENYQPGSLGLPAAMIETAEDYAKELTRTASRQVLLHGDLHHFNILNDQGRGWTAIDPKGVVGDPAFQAGRFLSNPYPDFLSYPDPLAVTRQRLEIIAAELKQDRRRLLAWAYVDTLLGACWSIEDSEEPGYSYECARIFARILENES